MRDKLRVSERRACRVIGQARTTQRRELRVKDDEEGRYGYRTVTGAPAAL